MSYDNLSYMPLAQTQIRLYMQSLIMVSLLAYGLQKSPKFTIVSYNEQHRLEFENSGKNSVDCLVSMHEQTDLSLSRFLLKRSYF